MNQELADRNYDGHDECQRYAHQLEQDVRDLGKGFDRLREALEFVESQTVPGPLLDVVRNALHDGQCGDVATSPQDSERPRSNEDEIARVADQLIAANDAAVSDDVIVDWTTLARFALAMRDEERRVCIDVVAELEGDDKEGACKQCGEIIPIGGYQADGIIKAARALKERRDAQAPTPDLRAMLRECAEALGPFAKAGEPYRPEETGNIGGIPIQAMLRASALVARIKEIAP